MSSKFKVQGLKLAVTAFCYCLLLLVPSCVPKPIDIDIEPPTPKLVVSSQIIPNQIMIVELTKTFSALASPTENDTVKKDFLKDVLVENAFVTVKYEGKTDTLFMLSPGIYASITTNLNAGGEYQLYAYDPKTELEVTATTVMQPSIKFDTIFPYKVLSSTDTLIKADITFTDFANQDNWYLVNFYGKSHGESTTLDITNYFGLGVNKLLDFELLSDQTFEKSQYHIQKELPGVEPNDTIAVAIAAITQGYFNYLSAYKRSGSLFTQVTGEPVNYPTNVIGGYGYFSAQYPDVKYFYLKDY